MNNEEMEFDNTFDLDAGFIVDGIRDVKILTNNFKTLFNRCTSIEQRDIVIEGFISVMNEKVDEVEKDFLKFVDSFELEGRIISNDFDDVLGVDVNLENKNKMTFEALDNLVKAGGKKNGLQDLFRDSEGY